MMKIADIVKNSIWHDPRVRKQIISYINYGFEVAGVGVFDSRYNEEEIKKLGCINYVSDKKVKNGNGILGKIVRELKTNKRIEHTILNYQPDVIHANDLNALIPSYKAYKKIKKRKKVFLIYDSHEIFLENPWINRNPVHKMIWSYYEKRIIKSVDLLVCVSHASERYFRDKYNIDKILVVTNSVMNNSIMSRKSFPSSFDVLNQGQFYEGRGYEEMIDAAKKCEIPNVTFTLRGFGKLESELKLKARQLELSNVVFANPVSTPQLIDAASKSDIAVAITKNISKNFLYSISNKIFEYAAAGLPIIMSNIPEHKYLNDKYHFGVIIPHDDCDSILKALSCITSDKSYYETLSKNAINMAKSTCWEIEFAKIIKEIENEN